MAPLPVGKSSKSQVRTSSKTRLAYDGGDYVYATGINLYQNMEAPTGFFRYSLSGDAWEELPESYLGMISAGGSSFTFGQ